MSSNFNYPGKWNQALEEARKQLISRYGRGPYDRNPQKIISERLRYLGNRYDTGRLSDADKEALRKMSSSPSSPEDFIRAMGDRANSKTLTSKIFPITPNTHQP